jgi:hypothetical protein
MVNIENKYKIDSEPADFLSRACNIQLDWVLYLASL